MYILLAVALYAAIAYAVTKSSRSGSNTISKDTIRLHLATVQNFALRVRTSIMRMKILDGYEPWQIDYSKTGFTSNTSSNTNCTSSYCKLHDPSGGGIEGYILPQNYWATGSLGKYEFINVGIKGIGDDNQRDLALLYAGVTKDFCLAVNDVSGVTNPSGNPPLDNHGNEGGYAPYSGALSNDVTLATPPDLGVAAPEVAGKTMFCTDNNGGSYYFWVVKQEKYDAPDNKNKRS